MYFSLFYQVKREALHLYTVLIAVIARNSTTPGFIGLYITIGELNEKNKMFRKDARISSGAPPKEIKRMQCNPSSNSN